MAGLDEDDTGEDPTLELAPMAPRRSRAEAQAQAAALSGGGAGGLTDAANALVKALQGATAPPKTQVRYPPDSEEIHVLSNKEGLHVAAADLHLSQVAASAYGMDGASRKYALNERIVMRPGKGLESLLAKGLVRIDEPPAAAIARGRR